MLYDFRVYVYWMRALKTLPPDGLNIEDCV